MNTSIAIDTGTQELIYNNGCLTLPNKDGSPLELPQDYLNVLVDPKDHEIVKTIKVCIEKPHRNQMQLIAATSFALGNQTVKRILKKYENILWIYSQAGTGRQSQAFTYSLTNKQ